MAFLLMPLSATTELARNVARVADGKSFNYDFSAALNPAKAIGNVARDVEYCLSDTDKGIWLGKKDLGNSHVGLSLSAGVDVWHWALLIDGYLYELVSGSAGKVSIHCTSNKKKRNEFLWHNMHQSRRKSFTEIDEVCDKLRDEKYHLLALFDSNKLNCQTFLKILYCTATGKSKETGAAEIVGASGGCWY
eukprot:TRINITY_DN57656_c0_g1_i1.p1 TRINITY_DN57656_c0_g1~~TRINITY_DN57656_c0_g1_i1.p1  ORF type:complete len:191 (+),score=22.07 TRINITY_DN57656_c0_g1_i1:115-687(+)